MQTRCEALNSDGKTKCPYSAKRGNYCNIHFSKYDPNAAMPSIGTKEYNNLFIIKFPEIAKEWDFEKNEGININTISYSSHVKVWWKCLEEHSYQVSLNGRTRKGSKFGCKQCGHDSLRIHTQEEVEVIRNDKREKKSTTATGDATENFILKLLLNCRRFKKVVKIGNVAGNADICITNFDNSVNYIQVKTLTRNNAHPVSKDLYYLTYETKYPDDMLIVMVNQQRTRFALEFAKNIKVKRLSLTYDTIRTKYADIMFTDVEEFREKLIELIPLSTTENTIGKSILKEIEMLQRFENFCNNHNITYMRNETNGNTIDGYINGYSFQAKFRNKRKKKVTQETYSIDSCKSAGLLNGKHIKKNYESGEFDFFIVELGGSEKDPDKYKGNFCIIPAKILIEQEIFKTSECKGKKAFYICPPDYDKPHWSKDLWNNITCIPKDVKIEKISICQK
jgi:hypothetical protein